MLGNLLINERLHFTLFPPPRLALAVHDVASANGLCRGGRCRGVSPLRRAVHRLGRHRPHLEFLSLNDLGL